MGSELIKVFVSYSWDNDQHKEWVLTFVNQLRRHGIDAFIDQTHLQLGARSPQFMEQSVTDSDRVLVICTEQYKQRFDDRKGGAGYEGHIISAEIVCQVGKNKFIPVLRAGDWATALPIALTGCYGVDLRKDSEEEFRKLIESLHGVSHIVPVGPRPAWLGTTDPSIGEGFLGTADADEKYWAQRKKLPDTELMKTIWTKPRWCIWIRPKEFRKARFQSVESCKEFMLSRYVLVKGWYPYPYFSADALEKGDEWIGGEIQHSDNGMSRLERWALFRSAQFVHNRAIDEIQALDTKIHVHEILDTVTAAFEFLARMAERALLAPAAVIRFDLYGVDGRALTWPDGPSDVRLQNCWSQLDAMTIEKSIVSSEAENRKRVLALEVACEIFANFGWENPPETVLREDQERRIGAVN